MRREERVAPELMVAAAADRQKELGEGGGGAIAKERRYREQKF